MDNEMGNKTDGPDMTETSRRLTIDEAISAFRTMAMDQLGDAAPGDCGPPESPEEAETRRFLMAQYLIGLACPAPAACRDYSCRRDAMCRHLVHVRGRWNAGKSSHPRRPPGADALRYAIWVYVSAQRERG
jgi:hypothetical protein